MIAKTHQYTPNCGAAAAIEREGSGLSWEVEQFKVAPPPDRKMKLGCPLPPIAQARQTTGGVNI